MSAAVATAIGPAAYGYRLHPRQDFSGLVGCVLRCRCLRRRGAGGTGGHGGRWHPADPLRAEAAVDRSGAAQGDHGDLVRDVLRHAVARHWPAVDIPFGTLYTLFARWTRLGLWRRLLNRLILAWRRACGDTADPSAVILDSPLSLSASGQLSGERSCRSAPSCFGRGFDGGKKINGVKVHLGVDTQRAAKLIPASRWRSTSRPPTCMIRKGSSQCSANSPAKASGDRRWATSATG